jgi:hypothetical protein
MKRFNILLLACLITGSHLQSEDTLKTHKEELITPSAGPHVENGADVFITANILYWKATQFGLEFAYSNPNNPHSTRGSNFIPNFQFEPGFQVGFGLKFAHDNWDVYANYTWFHPQNQSQIFTNNQNGLDFFQTSQFDQTYSSGKMDFLYKLDVIDFEIGRNFLISEYLALRPFVGLKAAWNREVSKQYFSNANHYLIRINQKSFEIGSRLGLDSHFNINSNWSLYGNSAFSVLSSKTKNHIHTIENQNLADETLLSTVADKQNYIQPVVELELGIQWDVWSESEEYHLGVDFGWEYQYWNNNLYSRVPIIGSSDITSTNLKGGDLSIMGLNIKFRFDF